MVAFWSFCSLVACGVLCWAVIGMSSYPAIQRNCARATISVLKETLQRNGVAEKIKGQVRAEVFKALDSKQARTKLTRSKWCSLLLVLSMGGTDGTCCSLSMLVAERRSCATF